MTPSYPIKSTYIAKKLALLEKSISPPTPNRGSLPLNETLPHPLVSGGASPLFLGGLPGCRKGGLPTPLHYAYMSYSLCLLLCLYALYDNSCAASLSGAWKSGWIPRFSINWFTVFHWVRSMLVHLESLP